MEQTTNYSGSLNVIELKSITQKYKDKQGKEFTLFDGLDFVIEDTLDKGQFVALMGESGCGKSTLLRYITGLQIPTSGDVLVAGNPLSPAVIIPMVFQMPTSLEWYTVKQNVALPLTLKGVSQKQAEAKAMEMIKVVGLEGHENKYAKSPLLSGGQLQRVAIARSLVANPTMLMMDEPFSALDIYNRRKMQEFLMNLFNTSEVNNLNPTIVMVTHDEREAVFLANDIIVMSSNPGKIKAHIKIDLPDIRTKEVRKSQRFNEIVSYLEDLIES